MKAILPLILLATIAYAGETKPPIGVPSDAVSFNGRWFKVFYESVPWTTARQKCEQARGRLAIVPDDPTWTFIKSLTPSCVWLGATDEKKESVWEWINGGGAVAAVDWAANQPDNAGGQEHYMALWKEKVADVPKDGKVGAQRVAGYICEWK